MIHNDIWGFENFTRLNKDYQNWCDERSYSALGKKSIAQAAKTVGFERKSFKEDGKLITRYVCRDYDPQELVELKHRWGMYQKIETDVELTVNDNAVKKTYAELMELL